MVWVSNRTPEVIYVSITNKTGGGASWYHIFPKNFESWPTNHWNRNGDEEMKIKLGSCCEPHSFIVSKDDFIQVYEDTVLIVPNTKAFNF